MRFTRITIIRTRKPESVNVNELLQWFSGTLGLFNPRDKDRSCFRVFVALLNDVKKGADGLTSDELAEMTSLTRGTVVYHLNKLMESGLVVSERSKYFLKVNSLEQLVDVVRADVNTAFDSLKEKGKELDKMLGLK